MINAHSPRKFQKPKEIIKLITRGGKDSASILLTDGGIAAFETFVKFQHLGAKFLIGEPGSIRWVRNH